MSDDITYESFLKGTSPTSYYGRIKARRDMDTLSRKVAYDHAYRPTNAATIAQFFKLKQEDSNKLTTASPSYSYSNSNSGTSWTSKVMDEESSAILKQLQTQASTEFIQNFYNSYMSPANSDICYRLGTVTRSKHLMYNEKGEKVPLSASTSNEYTTLGQTDRFGRIDTVSNLRVQINIEASEIQTKAGKPLTPGYSEYYVNWYFPPYTSSSFDVAGINRATLAATKAAANKAYNASIASPVTDFEKYRQAALDISAQTKTTGLSYDTSVISTYDPVDMMCARDGFTYRTAGFKAINDNISFLQHIFEECSGIVSTYLTEWDLSLYIQEGLLTEKSTKNVWLCNRIESDNPQGLTGADSYVWGALNAAVSKLPVNGSPANEKIWMPQSYYLSSYWWPYPVTDRGDGLGQFWDYATAGYSNERVIDLRSSFAGRIRYDDYVHAAYAGWKTFDDIQYYQLLYTTSDDGLSAVDIVHSQESNGTADSPYDTLPNEIRAIQDALYADDENLGFGDTSTIEYVPGGQADWKSQGSEGVYETAKSLKSGGAYNRLVKHYKYTDAYDSNSKTLDYTDYYYNDTYVATTDSSGNNMNSDTNSVSIGGEGNISILGAEIPGSSLLKLFLKRNSSKKSALGIASKTQSGFGSLGSTSSGDDDSSSSSGTATAFEDLFSTSTDENGRYSNPLGIPRLGPALFGGPHGAYMSPQTMQAYFAADNPFLQSIARINPDIQSESNNFTSTDKKTYYQGVEASYMYPAGRGKYNCYIGRSPSETLHLLTSGICDYVPGSVVNIYEKRSEYIDCNGISISTSSGSSGYSGGGYSGRYGGSSNFLTISITSYKYPTQLGQMDRSKGTGIDTVEYGSSTRSTYRTSNYDTGIGSSSYRNYTLRGGKGIRRVYIGSNKNIWVEYYIEQKYGTYGTYVRQTYNRPMLHCIPLYAPMANSKRTDYSHWQIAKYSATIDPDVKTSKGSFADFLEAWGGNDEEKLCGEYQEMKRIYSQTQTSNELFYRLTMPYYGDNYKFNTQSGKVGWYETISGDECKDHPNPTPHITWTDRYRPEEEVVSYMLKNSGTPGSGSWTDITFCYSDPNDSLDTRKTKGPRALIRVPTRLQKRSCTYNEFKWWITDYHHKPRCKPCHKDYAWQTLPDVETTYNFIECDIDNTQSFWASSNFSEVYTANIVNKDIMSDIPGKQYQVPVKNSVWQLLKEGPAPKKFRFAGKGFTEKDAGNDGGAWMHGWGMYNALPGFGTFPGQNSFEDPNPVLCIGNTGFTKDQPIKNVKLPLPIFNSANGPLRDLNGELYYNPYTNNKKSSYDCGYMSTYDPGMENFLKCMYTSCTLFTNDGTSIKGALTPFTTDISNCIISAMKLVAHQKAYLKFAKELFANSVDANEILRIIDKCVDKKIKYVSIGAHKDVNSIYYNPWIELAYNLYSSPTANKDIADAFDTRISAIETFIKNANDFMRATNASTIDEISAKNWSYNDYISCYGVFASFKSLCSKIGRSGDESIEEYFYSYLNVLYEYRRFYINKRCNKQDGTLWICRAFESVIPILAGDASEEDTDLGRTIENMSNDTNEYNIVMKSLTNSIYDKGKAIAQNTQLSADRIKRLYMPCVSASKSDWDNFISGSSDKEIIRIYKEDPLNKGVTTTTYIEKPVDGTYQLVSKEYLDNQKNKDYISNLRDLVDAKCLDEETYNAKVAGRVVNDKIEDCIFPISWLQSSDSTELSNYLEANKSVKEAAKNQAARKEEYITAQENYTSVIESNTLKLQAQEVIVTECQEDVTNANSDIMNYSDYAEYFYNATTGTFITETGESKSNYEKLAEMSSSGLSASLNFDNVEGLYAYYANELHDTDEDGKETTTVIGDARSNFANNVTEIYSKVFKYISAIKSIKSYEAKLAEAKSTLEAVEAATKADEATAKSEVTTALDNYTIATNTFNSCVASQKAIAAEYATSRKNSIENRDTKYTWNNVSHSGNDTLHPTIIFNLVSGMDVSKIDPTSITNGDAKSALCNSSTFTDYWCITPPTSPLDIGYDTRLKIKTYSTSITDASNFSANMATTAAGPFAYSLYPITEDQEGAIAAIGASLTDVDSLIKNTYS